MASICCDSLRPVFRCTSTISGHLCDELNGFYAESERPTSLRFAAKTLTIPAFDLKYSLATNLILTFHRRLFWRLQHLSVGEAMLVLVIACHYAGDKPWPNHPWEQMSDVWILQWWPVCLMASLPCRWTCSSCALHQYSYMMGLKRVINLTQCNLVTGCTGDIALLGPLLLTWFNFNPSMDK